MFDSINDRSRRFDFEHFQQRTQYLFCTLDSNVPQRRVWFGENVRSLTFDFEHMFEVKDLTSNMFINKHLVLCTLDSKVQQTTCLFLKRFEVKYLTSNKMFEVTYLTSNMLLKVKYLTIIDLEQNARSPRFIFEQHVRSQMFDFDHFQQKHVICCPLESSVHNTTCLLMKLFEVKYLTSGACAGPGLGLTAGRG